MTEQIKVKKERNKKIKKRKEEEGGGGGEEKRKKNRKRKKQRLCSFLERERRRRVRLKTVRTKQKAEHREKRLSIARIVFYVGTGFK